MNTITIEIPESTIKHAREIRDAAMVELPLNEYATHLGACIAAIGFFLEAVDEAEKT